VSREDDVLDQLRVALDELAAEETAALVEEARIEARARVRALLAEALAERMLARAESALAGEAPPARPADPRREPPRSRDTRRTEPPVRTSPPAREADRAEREPASNGAFGWYVYGIVDERFEAPPMHGVDDEHALEVVPAAGLGALTSRVPLAVFGEPALQEQIEDLAWLEHHARRHEQILESVREQRATVVPMRLFTIYESTDSLRRTLERERVFLAAALGRLAGRTEWGVKLFAGTVAEDTGGDADPQEDEAGPGESYLRRRRAADQRTEELSRELHERADQAHLRLAGAAVEARVNPLQPPELSEHEGTMVLNGVYLVDNNAVEAFSAEVTRLQDEYAGEGIDVLLTGPWPPYNFVNSSKAAEV
jgi:hypothetical protein